MAENLYCPRCAKPFTPETSFCRTCGLSLEGVTQIVTGEAESAPAMMTRPNLKRMRYGVGILVVGMAIALLHGAIHDFGLYPEVYGKIVILPMIAIGMLTIASGVFFPKKVFVRPKSAGKNAPDDGETGLDTDPLALDAVRLSATDIEFPKDQREPDAVPASVTEHTTRKLQ